MRGITKATQLLKPGGRLIIVSFHSIEDKIVKFYFSNFSQNKSKPSRYLPDEINNNSYLFENYNKKAFKPSINEIKKNSPSRSAKLRFATRSKNKFIYPANLFLKFNKYLNTEAHNA